MATIATNIAQRGGSRFYYARIAVPIDLHGLYNGRRELWRSLGTRCPKEARVKVLAILSEWHAEFAEKRRLREPTEADLEAATWEHYRTEIELHDAQRRMLPTEGQIAAAELAAEIAEGKVPWSDDPVVQMASTAVLQAMKGRAEFEQRGRAALKIGLRKHLSRGETALMEWAADDLIERKGLLIEKDSPAYRALCERLARAHVEALERAEERDRGDFTGTPRDAIVRPPLHVSQAVAAPGESIVELFDRFQREKAGAVTADTWQGNRKVVQLFAEFVGETAHVSAVNRKSLRDFKAELFKWPIKAADTKAFAGMSFRKVIEANARIGKPTITPKTINKYLSALGKFCAWLKSNSFIDENPMIDMFLDIERDEKKRLPFTSEQLTTLFTSPLFVGCKGDGAEHKPGNVKVRDWRYWLPLVALYSGARLGELAQLLVGDVRQVHGVWVLHVTREGGGKSVKTAGSERIVPLHSELIKLGFIAYHYMIKASGAERLFPGIRPDARGFFSGEPSGFFADYLKAIGVKVDKAIAFHSFRHTVADAFRRAGFYNEMFAPVLGHTKASTTGRYGIVDEVPLADRLRMIESVAFPGLDMSALYA
jgi:integrase